MYAVNIKSNGNSLHLSLDRTTEMEQGQIKRVLQLMKLMTDNDSYTINDLARKLDTTYRSVYRYIDTFKDAGLAVVKHGPGIYSLESVGKQMADISKLVMFSEEEGRIVNNLIDSLDNSNSLKRDLKRKLSSIYKSTSLGEFVSNKSTAKHVEYLGEAMEKKKVAILHGYQSPHSGTSRDRIVEAYDFTSNLVDVWCLDLEDKTNKIFKISRIGKVEILERPWEYESWHEKNEVDIFRMSGKRTIPVTLELGLQAKNLLLEEYPMAEKDLVKGKNGEVLLKTKVSDLAGVGRFVMGLAHDIKVKNSPELMEYLRHFDEQYVGRLLNK